MTKNGLLSVLILMLVVTLPACKGNSAGVHQEPPPPVDRPAVITPATVGTVISSPSPTPVTAFLQTVPNMNLYDEYFMNQANIWDVDNDFDLVNDQFPWALDLTIGQLGFPYDQTYNELTFYSPAMGMSDGVQVAGASDGLRVDYPAIGVSGTGYSAYIPPISDARLQQTISLPSGTTYTVTWADYSMLDSGNFSGYTPQYSVLLRDTSGNLLRTLYTTTSTVNTYDGTEIPIDYAGQTIVLSFEVQSAPDHQYQTFTVVDDVSIKDPSGVTNYVQNGDFALGLGYWTTNTPIQVQNMTSGMRSIEGLNVTRSFYTVPNKLWGRWVDMFENTTGNPITKTITYTSMLGSFGSGIIYKSVPADTLMRALSSWDSGTLIRDVGLVFGKATTVDYLSASGFNSGDGNDLITVTYDITVPANSSVALVNFVIMNGKYTGQSATTISAKATEIDMAAYYILTKFWTEAQYRDGMTQKQMDAIVNF